MRMSEDDILIFKKRTYSYLRDLYSWDSEVHNHLLIRDSYFYCYSLSIFVIKTTFTSIYIACFLIIWTLKKHIQTSMCSYKNLIFQNKINKTALNLSRRYAKWVRPKRMRVKERVYREVHHGRCKRWNTKVTRVLVMPVCCEIFYRSFL